MKANELMVFFEKKAFEAQVCGITNVERDLLMDCLNTFGRDASFDISMTRIINAYNDLASAKFADYHKITKRERFFGNLASKFDILYLQHDKVKLFDLISRFCIKLA